MRCVVTSVGSSPLCNSVSLARVLYSREVRLASGRSLGSGVSFLVGRMHQSSGTIMGYILSRDVCLDAKYSMLHGVVACRNVLAKHRLTSIILVLVPLKASSIF